MSAFVSNFRYLKAEIIIAIQDCSRLRDNICEASNIIIPGITPSLMLINLL